MAVIIGFFLFFIVLMLAIIQLVRASHYKKEKQIEQLIDRKLEEERERRKSQ
ncbi:hypothetical protein [Alkalicoccobacillus murimartini]|uniref:Membrane protein n=1 Tax=Alkalicoccobacillus murimartini TaxID=171685 RepID=A0ABT9YEG4_9BACI|nr:hypothetical protein [Alkalicoccobacillus murimartini]MDQ0206008.1 putative membrane protein [Alkalicoccobacillus murimartini]